MTFLRISTTTFTLLVLTGILQQQHVKAVEIKLEMRLKLEHNVPKTADEFCIVKVDKGNGWYLVHLTNKTGDKKTGEEHLRLREVCSQNRWNGEGSRYGTFEILHLNKQTTVPDEPEINQLAQGPSERFDVDDYFTRQTAQMLKMFEDEQRLASKKGEKGTFEVKKRPARKRLERRGGRGLPLPKQEQTKSKRQQTTCTGDGEKNGSGCKKGNKHRADRGSPKSRASPRISENKSSHASLKSNHETSIMINVVDEVCNVEFPDLPDRRRRRLLASARRCGAKGLSPHLRSISRTTAEETRRASQA